MSEHAGVDEMECKHLIELVTDYLEGALPADERAELEAHLEECDWCERYIEQTRQVIGAVGRVGDDPDPDAWEGALRAFRERHPPA
jgi:anti-sigma factor RsiW